MLSESALERRIARWIHADALNPDARRPWRGIDAITRQFRPRHNWVDGALQCLPIAKRIVHAHYPHLALELTFTLAETKRPAGFRFRTWRGVRPHLSRVPPDLCLYRPGSWLYMCRRFGTRLTEFRSGLPGVRCYGRERYDGVEECYRRFVSLVVPPRHRVAPE